MYSLQYFTTLTGLSNKNVIHT